MLRSSGLPGLPQRPRLRLPRLTIPLGITLLLLLSTLAAISNPMPARARASALTFGAKQSADDLPIPIPAPDHTGTGISGWSAKTPPLTTPWTSQVSPTNALPDYPRPQLTRAQWANLDGVWEFAPGAAGQNPPLGQTLAQRILVPYPVESALSGIMQRSDHMWYHRTITVPSGWSIAGKGNKDAGGQRLLLHFGAVDYQTVIYVNGQQVGDHTGGYDAFTVDITDALARDGKGQVTGAQDVLIGVYDPTDGGDAPIGKQRNNPGGIFYTSTSGILADRVDGARHPGAYRAARYDAQSR